MQITLQSEEAEETGIHYKRVQRKREFVYCIRDASFDSEENISKPIHRVST